MPRWRFLIGLLAFAAAVPAHGQSVVTSPAPNSVDVTVYRNPSRPASEEMQLNWLGGYALVSETRTINVPAGESEIRFEGVAGGILPQSAIVTGFPEGIIERNRDAYLLSPGTLLERSLGRRVSLRRTSRATGQVRQEEAVIRTGADGAVVLQTSDGFEALRCTGLNETIVYDGVPAGLSTRPTLSVRARSSQAFTASVTLSYLASGFDWQANYVADLDPDGRHVQLFAWLTLASTDETSFPDADVQAVAGRLNREEADPGEIEASALNLTCWPAATTSDIPFEELERLALNPPPPPMAFAADESIVVTGTRVRRSASEAASPVTIIAQQEELGDLKLFRLPLPVTVAANSQKQVALLVRPRVAVQTVFRQRIAVGGALEDQPAVRYLVTRNRETEGLGVTLPSGGISLFTRAGERRLLIGQGNVDDRAIGDDVEIAMGEATGVRATVEETGSSGKSTYYRVTVSNDQARLVRYELELDVEEGEHRFEPRGRLGRRDGRPLWTATVPANGRVTFRYRLVDKD